MRHRAHLGPGMGMANLRRGIANLRTGRAYFASEMACLRLRRVNLRLKRFFGQRSRRGQSPVEHRGTFVCPFVHFSVHPPSIRPPRS